MDNRAEAYHGTGTKQGRKPTTKQPPMTLQSKRSNHAKVHQKSPPGRGTAAKALSSWKQQKERDGYKVK